MTTEPYGIDPASLPPDLLKDIAVTLGWANPSGSAAAARLRQLITPPPKDLEVEKVLDELLANPDFQGALENMNDPNARRRRRPRILSDD